MRVPAVVELRQYTLVPGRRDELIDLFEANFIESQEAAGIALIGTFRDLDNATRFVWLRGFAGMAARARSLAAFYDGPVWQRHRDAANSTMVDSDNVLLLRPARTDSPFVLDGAPPGPDASARTDRGVVEATILNLDAAPQEQELAYFDDEIAPHVAAAGALHACLVSEDSPNTFPALPVREGEHVLVWFAGYPDQAAYAAARETRIELERAAAQMPRLVAAPSVLRLSPTRRSRLTGAASAAVEGRYVPPKEKR